LTEIPEHLLKRSRDAKRALGLDVPAEAGAAPVEAAAQSANAPAIVAPAAGAPVPIPAGEPPPPEPPKSQWVANAESRKKIPYWVMPVLLFLPVWLIMYVGTLEEPTREEGVLYEGGEVYAENCASCHGGGGGGGVGPAFNNGAVIETFAGFEDQVAWIVHGTQGYIDAGLETYGDTDMALGGSGANMPNFGAQLEASEIMWATFYERIELGGYEEELPLAEAVFEAYESGELELPGHFNEGIDGDFKAEIEEVLAEIRAELSEGEEVAAG
jgi:mono/diheme cytochrome c family protein